jgi:hypothetical protein
MINFDILIEMILRTMFYIYMCKSHTHIYLNIIYIYKHNCIHSIKIENVTLEIYNLIKYFLHKIIKYFCIF